MDNLENIAASSVQPSKRSPWILRVLWRLFITFIILIVLMMGTGFIIGYYYQDKVKEYVIGELNKQLNTEIIVDGRDIDFTVLKNFPYASVDFKNVKALDAIPSQKKDTLFTAGDISFQFNILDIFKKNYHVKKIEIDHVNLKVRIDKDGNDNYHFWKPSADTASTAFSFALEKIELKNVHLSYKNSKAKQTIDLRINKSDFSGNFSNREYSLESTSDLFVNSFKIDSTRYLSKKNIHAEIALNIDNTFPSYKIKTAKVRIEDVLFEVFGSVINANHEPVVNLGIRGKDMDIKSVLSLIPSKYKGKINDYESDGEFYLDATVQGVIGNSKQPQIIADFGIKNANIKQVKDNIILHKVNLKVHY